MALRLPNRAGLRRGLRDGAGKDYFKKGVRLPTICGLGLSAAALSGINVQTSVSLALTMAVGWSSDAECIREDGSPGQPDFSTLQKGNCVAQQEIRVVRAGEERGWKSGHGEGPGNSEQQ